MDPQTEDLQPQVTNKKRWWRWLLISPAVVLGILLLAFGLLQVRWVQNQLLHRFLGRLNHDTGFLIAYDDFYLSWYDQLEVRGLSVQDSVAVPLFTAGDITVNFRFFDLFRGRHINVDQLILSGSRLSLSYSGTDSLRKLNLNRFVDRMSDYFAARQQPADSVSTPFELASIRISETTLALHDSLSPAPADRFNPGWFSFFIGSAQVNGFSIHRDTVTGKLASLSGRLDDHHWPVAEADTDFRLTSGSLEFLNTRISAGKSTIGDRVVLLFTEIGDLSDFADKVRFDIHLDSARLHPDDIRFFIGKVPLPGNAILLDGDIQGTVSSLHLKGLHAASGKTSVTGNIDFEGLPDLGETFINARIRNSTLNFSDLGFFLPPGVEPALRKFGSFRIYGNFTGFINDFVADASFFTRLGEIRSDVNLKVDQKNPLLSTYRGELQLRGFEAGIFLEDTALFQKVTLSGRIQGKGLSLQTADFLVDGNVMEAGILGYDYHDISTKARLANGLFIGSVTVKDPNLRLRAEGSIDIRDGRDEIRLQGRLDTAAFKTLRLSSLPISAQTNFSISTRGLTLDGLSGRIRLRNMDLWQPDRHLHIDSLSLRAINQPTGKKLIAGSDLGSIDVHGNFRYDRLAGDLQELLEEFYLNATNDKARIKEYYARKRSAEDSYRIDFLMRMSNLNPVLEFFNTGCTISRNIQVAGHFISGLTTIVHAYSAIPKFTYGEQVYTDNEIDFNGSKLRDSTNVLAMLLISSARQKFTEQVRTGNLIMEAIWDRDHIDLGIDADQEGFDNSLRLKSEIDFLTDSTRIRILPSQIRLLGKAWTVNPRNRILIKGRELEMRELELQLDDRSMKLSGRISEDPTQVFEVAFKDLTLDLLNALGGEKVQGTLNGTLEMRDLYVNPFFQNSFSIDGFNVNGFLVGDVEGINTWDPEQEAFVVRFSVDRLQRRMIDVTGLYRPSDPENPIDLTARFNQAQLKLLEPFTRDLFSNLSGTASGTFDIRGGFSQPSIQGTAMIEDGKATVNYLNTTYGIRGPIVVSDQSIDFRNLELRDALQNKGTLGGQITHRNFTNFHLNITSEFRNFQALNTNEKQNSLFYGQAFGTGTFAITGPLNRLHLTANARSDKNTRIYIPIQGTTTVERGSFIRFINLHDSVSRSNTDAKGKSDFDFSMTFNLEITPDAYSEIIFDKKAGDIIRGNGRGNLKMDIDTKGEFTMFGGFEFEKGFYNFTLGGVINKEFTINKGSKISWYGDPYGATLNIQAAYRQLTSLAPIMPQSSNPDQPIPSSLRRKFPIEVLLNLDGPMLSPQINFDIVARDLPDNLPGDNSSGPIPIKFQFNAFKARLDEQELKKQVFSLVVLRRFTPPDAFTTSGGISNSVSELLSNQLSYWLSQVDQNLEVTLDLGNLDQNAFNISQLRMSYSLMNGRLRITRDGTLFSSQYTQSNVAALAGDWMVDYLLTPDGKFKVKMYSRSNFNMLLSSLNTQSSYTTGLSLSHTQSFNRFSELLHAERRRQVDRPQTSEEDQ